MFPAKSQNSLRFRAVLPESSQCTVLVDKGPKRLQADSEDSDHTVWMRRWI